MDVIKIEDRNFLHMQQQKGRDGCMFTIDNKVTVKEVRNSVRVAKVLKKKRKSSFDQYRFNLVKLCN